MAVLVIVGFVTAVLAAYAADRALKAWRQVRRLRAMSDRLAAAVAKADRQQEQHQVAERRRSALTVLIPAIRRPPLSLPGMTARRDHATDGDRGQQHQRRLVS